MFVTLLLAMTLLKWTCYIFVVETLAKVHRRDDVLWRTMDALNRALDYLNEQIDNINLDGVIGTRMADDQITVLVNRSTLFSKRRQRRLLRPLFFLQRKAEIITNRAIPKVKSADPHYFKRIGRILSNGLWLLNYPERKIAHEHRREDTSYEKIDETKSDECIAQVVGTEDDIFCPCRVSEECWALMTAPKYSGYSLTHEVIFLHLIEMCNCHMQVKLYLQKCNQTSIPAMVENFCSDILNEAEAIIEEDEKTRQDLFMEQIAICGMAGFVDFYRPQWLKAILDWQLPSGCYAERKDPAWPEDARSRKKIKREEKILEDGCHSHTTSVAVITLAVNIRFVLTQELNY